MKLLNLKIGARLGWGFGVVMMLAALQLLLALWGMQQLNASTEMIVTERLTSLSNATKMQQSALDVALTLHKLVAPTDAAEAARDKKRLEELFRSYVELEAQTGAGGAGAPLLAEAVARRQALKPALDALDAHVLANNFFDAASTLKTAFQPKYNAWMQSLVALAQAEEAAMRITQEQSSTTYRQMLAVMLGGGLVSIVLAALIARGTTRTITVPLREAEKMAEAIAKGDLTQAVTHRSEDEIGHLIRLMTVMQQNLLEIVSRIKAGSESIAVSSREIAAGNADLSARTERQAASLEETAASMEELAGTVRSNADNSVQANQLAGEASEVATTGGSVIDDVIVTMESIRKSSQRVVDIISVIDSIAFQTNILALNAAVEASRAGEQGRGFAVVAAEVRALAHRSANAAKEIKGLIGESVEQVDCGSKLVDDAGRKMQDIVASVKRVADLMQDISVATQEQSTGLDSVSRAVSEMDETTQRNAALVEQASAAALAVERQSADLVATVARFVIK